MSYQGVSLLKKLALLLSLFSSFIFPLFALNLSVNIAKEAGESFSIIQIKEDIAFRCLSKKDEFDNITQIQCIFPREPKQVFEKMQTRFFKIDSFVKHKKYYVRIYPLQKMKLFPILYSLHKNESIYQADETLKSKHWTIVGFKDKLPLIKIEKTPPLGINFPIAMQELALPSVGALDISGNPIFIEKLKDVSAYMRVKNAYDSGHYENLAESVDKVFTEFPNTIFKSELLLYKIRGYHKTDESEDLIGIAKNFIWEYSDDEHIPEVLAYLANAYSNIGLQADANYFYERLFKEFPDSKYAPLGMIFLGDQYISGGKQRDAINYYKKALYLTKDVEIASMAALRLARISLDKGDMDKSSELIEKVVKGNPKYLLYNIAENYDIARTLANRKYQRIAADMLEAMLSNLPKKDDRYETMMKDIGIYLSETDDKPRAYKALKRYQKEYAKMGEYKDEVQEALDSLFYTPEDANKTALLQEYENLEQKYANQEIGKKARLERARLYYSQKQYQKVLDLEGSGIEEEAEYEQLKHDSAKALAMISLEKGECEKAINLSSENNITLDSKFDTNLFKCAYTTGNYSLALKTAKKHLKDKDRLKWLYDYAKTLFKEGKYDEVVKVSADILTLSDIEKTSEYDDILHDTFYSYERLKDQVGMIKTIKELERRRGLRFDDIELYVTMIKLGLKQKDDIIIQTYSNKVMKLQDKTSTYTQSPFVEFAALQVLKSQKKDKEQMALLKKLIKRKISNKEMSRAQYMLGSLLLKEGKNKEAKEAFEASIKADENSAWAGLSKDALELIK